MSRIFLFIFLPLATVALGTGFYEAVRGEPDVDDRLPYYNHVPNKRAFKLNNKAMGFSDEFQSRFLWDDKPKEAIALLDEAIGIDPLYTMPYYNKCLLLMKERNFPEALKAIKKNILLNPREPIYYVFASAISKAMKKDEEALKYHNKAIRACELQLKDKPNDIRFRQGIYFLYASIGEKEKAIEGLEKMLQDEPGNALTETLMDQIKSGQIKIMEIPDEEPCHTMDKLNR